jgi:hypothetical protein
MIDKDKAELELKRMDFDKDQRAWEMAKGMADQDEALSVTVARAQRIKESL